MNENGNNNGNENGNNENGNNENGQNNGNGKAETPVVVTETAETTTEHAQSEKTNALANQANKLEFGEEIRKMLSTAGTLELTPAQNEILYAKLKDDDIYVKPNGLIYLSWFKYSERLTKAFTGTGWAMIPQGMPKISNNLIVWGFHLVIKGVYCGFAIGEQEYFENGRMSYGEGCEGAKSNALMRLCKSLGIGLELWDKDFANNWVNTYTDKKWEGDQGRGKWVYKMKPNAFGKDKAPVTATNTSNTSSSSPVTSTPASNDNGGGGVKKEEPKKEEPKTDTTGKGGKGGGKKGKIEENKDFLKQGNGKNGKNGEVKMEEIKENEVTGGEKTDAVVPVASVKVAELTKLVEESPTTGKLKMNYETVKKAQAAGEITEEEKEVLRKTANKLFVKLASEGK